MALETTPQGDFAEDSGDVLDALTAVFSEENGTVAEPEQVADAAQEVASDDQAELETTEVIEDPNPPAKIKIKVAGEDRELTLDELKDGYELKADYTRKTQALSEQRKATEQEALAARAERQQYQNGLRQIAAQLDKTAPPKPDDSIRFVNPAEWAAQAAQYQNHLMQAQAVAAEFTRTQQLEAAHRQMAQEKAMAECAERLPEIIPEWRDKAIWKKETAAMSQYALEHGYTEEELSQVSDPRNIALLRDAWKYRELVNRAKTMKPKPQAIQTARPGATGGTSRPRAAAAIDRLSKSGSLEDAALAMLG